MLRSDHKILSTNIWFCILILYIVTGYLAQDMIMPSAVNSMLLYIFLAYSLFEVFLSRHMRLVAIVGWSIAFLLISFFAMLYSPSFSLFSGTYYELIVNFILILLMIQMPWNRKRFQLIMNTYTLSATVLIGILAATGNLKDDSGRLGTELFGNSNILAMALMVSALYGFWMLISSDKRLNKFLYAIEMVVVYIGMFYCGGRKFVVVPIVFFYVLMLHKTDGKGSKHIVRDTIIIVGVLIILYQLIMKLPAFYNTIGNRFEGLFSLFGQSYDMDSSTQKRELMMKAAFSQWTKSPLWGYGFDSFKYYNASSVTGHMYYSHNNYTELLYNQGLIGFVTYYAFYLYLLLAARKQKNVLYRGFAVAAVLSLLILEFGAVTYSMTPTQFILFFAFYCVNFNENADVPKEQSGHTKRRLEP